MNQKNLFKQSTIAVAVALFSANVSAAGFQLNEYSSSGLGRAFSGEGAVADNATSGSRNPATMTMFDYLHARLPAALASQRAEVADG